ncbi:MAG: prepilin-type N-terminal cleavage/methylation domain-containing protein [Bacilli bacterium]|nr:prepilin-type N-terminal cleavage/methylation domain-containing protein [Bacilli bacterium]
MKNNKGFTLIEILAVIIILGILFMIAVPAVSQSIMDSRKSTFAESGIKYIDAAIDEINAFTYRIKDTNKTYYIPTSCLNTDKNEETPFGVLEDSYVVVSADNDEDRNYFYTGRDSSNHGILLTNRELLSKDVVLPSIGLIHTDYCIEGTSKTVIYDKTNCKASTEGTCSAYIPKNGALTLTGNN